MSKTAQAHSWRDFGQPIPSGESWMQCPQSRDPTPNEKKKYVELATDCMVARAPSGANSSARFTVTNHMAPKVIPCKNSTKSAIKGTDLGTKQ